MAVFDRYWECLQRYFGSVEAIACGTETPAVVRAFETHIHRFHSSPLVGADSGKQLVMAASADQIIRGGADLKASG